MCVVASVLVFCSPLLAVQSGPDPASFTPPKSDSNSRSTTTPPVLSLYQQLHSCQAADHSCRKHCGLGDRKLRATARAWGDTTKEHVGRRRGCAWFYRHNGDIEQFKQQWCQRDKQWQW